MALEIKFSRHEFVYRDYFRFLSAGNADRVKKHQAVAPSLSRVQDDLAWLRPTLTVPLWIVALK